VERRITGLTLQDRIDVTPKVSVTLGARRDSYSDLQSRTTPRAAVVWRATDRHILKAQYSEGFRPPTFFERYEPSLPGVVPRYPFEVNATTELNYIFRSAGRVGRATLFRTVITDMLRPGGVTVPGEAHANGFELEWSQQATSRIKVDANASHVTTRDPRNGNLSDPVAAGWLGNLAVYYQPLRNTFIGGRLSHVGDRRGGAGYDLADFTLSRRDLFGRGLGARVGVKDAFNDHPTYLTSRPNGLTPVVSLFPGRSFWMQFSWTR
jgi:outer membrane receptor protein involved in Fe transport